MGAMEYQVIVQRTDEGYSVGCPELPGCWSQGDTEQEALENITVAIQEYLSVTSMLSLTHGNGLRY